MQLLKLVQHHIQVGEPLPWNVRDGATQLLLRKGHVVASETQLEALLDRGAWVDLVEFEAAAAAARQASAAAAPLRTLFDHWDDALPRLEELLKSTAVAGFATRVAEFARHIGALVERDHDVAIYVAMRPDARRLESYGPIHALATAAVCHLIARRMAWSEAQLEALVKAALTMNLSVLALQGRLAALGQPPTESQRATLRQHPARSVEMLKEAGVDDAEWLSAVAHHHERADGSGYPQGLREIPAPALLLRHVDVFLAKVSARSQRAALPVQRAARELFQETAGGPIAQTLIKELGIYPPGDFVRLQSGELAVVVRRGATASTPLAATITDRKGKPVVATQRRDTSQPEFAIVAAETDRSQLSRLLPERLYGLVE